MKKSILVIIVVAVAALGYFSSQSSPSNHSPASESADNSALIRAYENHQSGIQVEGDGRIAKILPDDTDGNRHQRFIVRLDSGQTILIAHNIDIAPRAESLREGDPISFSGIYEWNEKGGVVHWTHRDPSGRHQPGWLKHDGKTYQ